MNHLPRTPGAHEKPLSPDEVVERVCGILDTYDSSEALSTAAALLAHVSNKHAVSFEDTVMLVANSLRKHLRPRDVKRAAPVKNAKALVALQSKLLHDVLQLKAHKAHVCASISTVLTALYVDDPRLHPVVDHLLFRAHLEALGARGRDPISGTLQLWEQHCSHFSTGDGMRIMLGALSSFTRERHIEPEQLLVMLATTLLPTPSQRPATAPDEDAANTAGPTDDANAGSATTDEAPEDDGVH